MYGDNQSTIHMIMIKNPIFHERSKHIDIKMHFIWDVIGDGKVTVKKVSIEANPSDALTKIKIFH